MPTVRHIIVCEGNSERAYIQSLQRFLESLPAAGDSWGVPLQFITSNGHVANGGHYTQLKKCYLKAKKQNRNVQVRVWADFDLFYRDTDGCWRLYADRGRGVTEFHFSFHNFEDFLALHLDGEKLETWLRFGREGHFSQPRQSTECLEWASKLFQSYQKGILPVDFVTVQSLRNLKANLPLQPRSNPHGAGELKTFAELIIGEIERFHPDILR